MNVGDNMINYPMPKNQPKSKKVSMSNRGMVFEKLIDEANTFYLAHHKAVIHKKPVPVQIVDVDYPSRNKARIKEAYYKTPSTTDYNGVYKGYYIDFDVKESRNKTSFPIKNIHTHQIEHLKHVHEHGGVAFLLIFVHALNQAFLLPYETLNTYFSRALNGGRKSITNEELLQNGYDINEGFRPRIDYLKAVKQYISEAKK